MGQLIQDILLIILPFLIWLTITFLYNLLKIPVEYAQLVENSVYVRKIVNEITQLQIEASKLTPDKISEWKSKAAILMEKIDEEKGGHYYLVLTQVIRDAVIDDHFFHRKAVEMQMNRGRRGGGAILPQDIHFPTSFPDSDIDFELSVLDTIKDRFLPYITPIKADK